MPLGNGWRNWKQVQGPENDSPLWGYNLDTWWIDGQKIGRKF